MELELMLYMEPLVVLSVFLCIVLIVLFVTSYKVSKIKVEKGEAKNDNRGNKKGSSKTNVHKSR